MDFKKEKDVMKDKRVKRKMTYAQVMAIGFFVIIAIGTFLLMLPISNQDGNWCNFLDAMFTATSATCVTGLVVCDTYTQWTMFGQLVILTMIQIGGLGFITISVMFSVLLKKKIGLNIRNLIQESVSSMKLSGVVKLTKNILKGTAIIEGIGALLLATRFVPELGFFTGIYYAIFHSISAFCNAGFDLFGRFEQYSSLTHFSSDIVVNVTIMLLIIIGGLGFIVWMEIKENKFHFSKYSLHSKIVIVTNFILIFGGAALFAFFEKDNLQAGMGIYDRTLSSLFTSVSARTAGFNTLDLANLMDASVILHLVLMFIGGNSGSTAGGIKTTTFVVFVVYIWSNIRNSSGCNIFGRRIGDEDIKKANMVLGLNLGLAIFALMAICASQNLRMSDVLMEVFSAIGTVGLSTGITRDLNTFSRCVLILVMYCGRIGSMTFAITLAFKRKKEEVLYPEEHINVG